MQAYSFDVKTMIGSQYICGIDENVSRVDKGIRRRDERTTY